jgi:hypothetical protein
VDRTAYAVVLRSSEILSPAHAGLFSAPRDFLCRGGAWGEVFDIPGRNHVGRFFTWQRSPTSGTPEFWPRCFFMSSDRIIVDALKLAHSLVSQNPRPTTDAATVLRLRELVHLPPVRPALQRGSDSLPTFALRDVARVLTDQSQTHGETMARIRNVLDEPHLNEALGLRQNGWIAFRPRPRNL